VDESGADWIEKMPLPAHVGKRPVFALASFAAADNSWLQEDGSWPKTTGHGASQSTFKPSWIKGVFLFNRLILD
jgi:hypothetical protein